MLNKLRETSRTLKKAFEIWINCLVPPMVYILSKYSMYSYNKVQ